MRFDLCCQFMRMPARFRTITKALLALHRERRLAKASVVGSAERAGRITYRLFD